MAEILIQSPRYESWDDVLALLKSKLAAFNIKEVTAVHVLKNRIVVDKVDETLG